MKRSHLSLTLVLLLALSAPALASLPSSVVVSSNSTYAGTYAPLSGLNGTYNGATQYSDGPYFLDYTGGSYGWALNASVNVASGGTHLWYTPSGTGTATTFPTTGWQVSGGSFPPPVFTPYFAPTLTALTLGTASVTGSGSVMLTATLSGVAPTGGQAVTITGTPTGTFTGTTQYASPLTVPAGQTSASETLTVTWSSGSGTLPLSGSCGGTSQSATLTLAAGSGGGTGTGTGTGGGTGGGSGDHGVLDSPGLDSGVFQGTITGVSGYLNYLLRNFATVAILVSLGLCAWALVRMLTRSTQK